MRLITALQVLQVLEVDILWPRWVARIGREDLCRIGEILAARDWRALALTQAPLTADWHGLAPQKAQQ